MKIAVLADIHYGSSGPPVERRSEIGDVLLRRAVRRLNRYLRPDVTLLLGDLLDDGGAPEAPERRAAAKPVAPEGRGHAGRSGLFAINKLIHRVAGGGQQEAPVGEADRGGGAGDEDEGEIPAFLRRQAN